MNSGERCPFTVNAQTTINDESPIRGEKRVTMTLQGECLGATGCGKTWGKELLRLGSPIRYTASGGYIPGSTPEYLSDGTHVEDYAEQMAIETQTDVRTMCDALAKINPAKAEVPQFRVSGLEVQI
ncbi:MAG TPA: hypothetical protein VLE91_00105 [Candidatus Saccharimonadales bacterium]|nr:hypothetical protein [Candidatus Saccharimonadales bacterium]